jgi:hypothetical protein
VLCKWSLIYADWYYLMLTATSLNFKQKVFTYLCEERSSN